MSKSRDKGREKSLKKLSRAELLEMLIAEEKRIDELEQELAEARKGLEEKRIRIERSGSIAEAALRLNGIFEAAQAAADQYLLNLEYRVRERTGADGPHGQETGYFPWKEPDQAGRTDTGNVEMTDRNRT